MGSEGQEKGWRLAPSELRGKPPGVWGGGVHLELAGCEHTEPRELSPLGSAMSVGGGRIDGRYLNCTPFTNKVSLVGASIGFD